MANRETSDEISNLAAKVMGMHEGTAKIVYSDLLRDAKRLAGSVLSQDETKGKPSAGTSAYEMVAAVEQQHIEVTETLIHMVAATVLMQTGNDVPWKSVTFSPADMDRMHREYEMTATRDGLLTTVRITPRDAAPLPPREAHLEDRPESLMTQDEPETPFEPQAAEHVYDRPLWAARIAGTVFPASNRDQAEQLVHHAPNDFVAQVENRFCYHKDCPAEHCNYAEVTSGIDASDAQA